MKILIQKSKTGNGEDVVQEVVIPENLVPLYSEFPHVEIEDLGDRVEEYTGQDLNDKSLLISRFGGGGDLLVITSVAKYLRYLYPQSRIALTADPTWLQLFNSQDNVYDKWYRYPIPASVLDDYDYLLTFEGVVEGSGKEGTPGPSDNIYDLFMEKAGLNPQLIDDKHKIPHFNLTKRTIKKAKKELGKRHIKLGTKKNTKKDTIIAVQWMASSPIRTYPPNQLQDVCIGLADKGYQVVILGQRKYVSPDIVHNKVHYLLDLNGGVTEAISVLKYTDLLLAPDSLFVHAAAAWNVPTVALYGPFTRHSRTEYYPNCTTLEAEADCAPCFLHGHKPCPNARGLYGECWDNLSPEIIIDECVKVLSSQEKK